MLRSFSDKEHPLKKQQDASGHPRIADDLLIGAKAIGDEIGVDERRAYYLLEKGYFPSRKMGRIHTSTRSGLRKHFQGGELERQPAKAAPDTVSAPP
jgi:hypothetical protein